MKKILSLLSSIVIVTSATFASISCSPNNNDNNEPEKPETTFGTLSNLITPQDVIYSVDIFARDEQYFSYKDKKVIEKFTSGYDQEDLKLFNKNGKIVRHDEDVKRFFLPLFNESKDLDKNKEYKVLLSADKGDSEITIEIYEFEATNLIELKVSYILNLNDACKIGIRNTNNLYTINEQNINTHSSYRAIEVLGIGFIDDLVIETNDTNNEIIIARRTGPSSDAIDGVALDAFANGEVRVRIFDKRKPKEFVEFLVIVDIKEIQLSEVFYNSKISLKEIQKKSNNKTNNMELFDYCSLLVDTLYKNNNISEDEINLRNGMSNAFWHYTENNNIYNVEQFKNNLIKQETVIIDENDIDESSNCFYFKGQVKFEFSE
ncbi:hypothetical protein [Spiroplasma endosymbiont of Dioctria linearis]|uniref:hypothetical protein n=1 Tax=Spiroplasma endosymbiont of Dioctria linearis TaxID=3066290 RepID=UPI00313D8647